MNLGKIVGLRAALALALVIANTAVAPAIRATAMTLDGNDSQQAAAAVPALPSGVERVTSVEGITEYRLASNGLRVLMFPDQSKQTIRSRKLV